MVRCACSGLPQDAGRRGGSLQASRELLTRIEKAMQLYPDDGAAYAYGCYILHNLDLGERALQRAELTIDPEDYNSHSRAFLAAIGAVEKAIRWSTACRSLDCSKCTGWRRTWI